MNVLKIKPRNMLKEDEPEIRALYISEGIDDQMNIVDAEVDSAAGMNCLPHYLYQRMKGKTPEHSATHIRAYGVEPKPVLGKVHLHLHTHRGIIKRLFQITDEKEPIIMG